MGIHTGAPLAAPPKYVGLDVHEAARIMAAGHGGQMLLSAATEHLLDRTTQLLDIGEHRLKDLSEPQPLYQLRVAGTSEEFPALKTLGNRPTNLPTVATPFIGRATELVDLRTMLHREGPRIVTVTGPGGVGKTRIALQAAADSLDQFRDGVYWVPFAAIRDSDLALGAIAATLGLREDAGEPVIATVARHLERKELLLVADNLEHILDAGLGLARLLEASPRVRMLVTSREPLRITGESVYDLPPLALPAADSDPTAEVVDAVDLFVTRAQSTDSTFTLTKENSADIAEIVRRLDGLPLAIELAAARIRALLPAALLRRLSNRLQVLTAGSRDAVERQCTLEATIAWSYDLLTPDEARLFARLSVFIGGFRIEAVDAVAADDASRSAFDEVASLLDKSLVRRRVDPDNEPRYWLLETIRDYAAERLRERGDQLQLQIGHAYFFADLAEAQDRALTDDDLEMRLQLIDADLPNFRAAAGWAEANNEASCSGRQTLPANKATW